MLLCIASILLIGLLLIVLFGGENWISAAAYLLAASAIAGGGCVAYDHLRIIRGTERASVLADLDSSWVSSELQSSRIAYLEFTSKIPAFRSSKKRNKYIEDELRYYRENEHQTYRNLLLMVDFLETVGYFCKVGYILSIDAVELYGPSISKNNETFRAHILGLQKESNDDSIYSNFIWLANEVCP